MNDTSPHETRKPRVAVVFGGRSSEHGISCVTAGSVLAVRPGVKGLPEARYQG